MLYVLWYLFISFKRVHIRLVLICGFGITTVRFASYKIWNGIRLVLNRYEQSSRQNFIEMLSQTILKIGVCLILISRLLSYTYLLTTRLIVVYEFLIKKKPSIVLSSSANKPNALYRISNKSLLLVITQYIIIGALFKWYFIETVLYYVYLYIVCADMCGTIVEHNNWSRSSRSIWMQNHDSK